MLGRRGQLSARVQLKHGRVDSHASTGNICVLHVLEIWSQPHLLHSQLWVAVRSMRTMVLEAVEVLVALATNVATIWLLFLHTNGTRVWYRRQGIDNRESAIVVLFELLILMAMLLVVLETILVLVGLFATDHGTPERLDLFWEGELWYARAVENMLFTHSPCELALVIASEVVILQCVLKLGLRQAATLLAEEALARLIDSAIVVVESVHTKAVAEIHVHVHAHVHIAHAHHWVEPACKVHVELCWRAGMRGFGRGEVVRHWYSAESGSVY